jgi:hypothetical protein
LAACCCTALTTCGWQWPVDVAPMPELMCVRRAGTQAGGVLVWRRGCVEAGCVARALDRRKGSGLSRGFEAMHARAPTCVCHCTAPRKAPHEGNSMRGVWAATPAARTHTCGHVQVLGASCVPHPRALAALHDNRLCVCVCARAARGRHTQCCIISRSA